MNRAEATVRSSGGATRLQAGTTLVVVALLAAAAACSGDADNDPDGAVVGDLGQDALAGDHGAPQELGGGEQGVTKKDGGATTATGGTGGAKGVVNASCQGRSYILHVPASYSHTAPSALVVAMHGLGDSYQNFFATCKYAGWTGAADTRGFIFMVPDHKNPNRKSFLHLKGNSFDSTSTKVEVDDLLTCVYKHVGANYNIETTKIFWIGFSEGATFTVYAAYALHRELRAVAPYAGAIASLPLPFARRIPAYFVCGSQDNSITQIDQAYKAWIGSGHPGKSSWVSGVGHSFSKLNLSGPSPDSVYTWLSTVACDPVISGYPGS
jgi:poly(3-hydroxybutyrate) depolymerase